MKLKKLIGGFIAIIFCACVANAVKIYVPLNTDGNFVTNVPTPIADTHAINKRYADQIFAANALNALPAKCADGQISGYTPVVGEDLHAGMQHGVDWSTNTRFTVDGNVVYDNLTGLMWTKSAAHGSRKTWPDAINYSKNLVYGGYSDWRLPNIKELASLLDLSKESLPLPDGNPFVGVHLNYYYWTSSTRADSTGNAWCVHTVDATIAVYSKIFNNYVWPVRAGGR